VAMMMMMMMMMMMVMMMMVMMMMNSACAEACPLFVARLKCSSHQAAVHDIHHHR
jgi:hypothetical protein